MRLTGTYDERVLHALGALSVAEVRDEAGKVIGFDVEPSVDLAGYDAALARHKDAERDAAFADLRAERDRRLSASDWTQVADAPLTDAQRQSWAGYRQELRDVPSTTAEPADVAWPVAPA